MCPNIIRYLCKYVFICNLLIRKLEHNFKLPPYILKCFLVIIKGK